MRWGNTEQQSDAQRKFCTMLWEICPLKVTWPGEIWALDSTMGDYGEQMWGDYEKLKPAQIGMKASVEEGYAEP